MTLKNEVDPSRFTGKTFTRRRAFPTSHDGEEETFEAAREAFKKVFWQWHAWALKQPGKATWYGADE